MQAAIKHLQLLIKDLLYISESDHPWQVLDLGAYIDEPTLHKALDAAAQLQNSNLEKSDANAFLEKTIRNLKVGGSAASEQLAARYEALYAYLTATFPQLWLFRITMGAQVHVFIVGVDKEGNSMALQTMAIET